MMQVLRNNVSTAPLKDMDGKEIRKGNIVTDPMFGDGIARGTVPLADGSGGVNVLVMNGFNRRPTNRRAEMLITSC